MNRKLLAVLAAGVMVALPAVASAQISTGFSVAAGLALPAGEGKDDVNSGYTGVVGLHLGAPLLPVGVRIEGAYASFEGKNNTGTASFTSGTVNGTFGLGLPYVIGGLGYYQAKAKVPVGTSTLEVSESAPGINGGVGMTFPLGLLSTYAEIRYHKMLGDKDKGADGSYIPITFGIKF